MIDASQTFDLNNVYQIQIPVNGKLEYVERIRNEQGKILWQVHRSNIKFRDNVPVTVAYDINIDNTGDYKYMYLIPVGDVYYCTACVNVPYDKNEDYKNAYEKALKMIDNLVSYAVIVEN